MSTIAYLGPPGTFSELAALTYGGPQASLLPLASFPAVVTAIETGVAAAGMLAIENSLEGSVGATLDLLIHETALQICAEVVVPVRHFLIAREGLGLPDIQVLYGHPQALGQCRRFIERCLPGVATVASLSNSAALNEALADPRATAAISTSRAAELYGGRILAHDIQDLNSNATRFVALAHEDAPPSGDDKTSLAFGFREDRAGVLVGVLHELANAGLNMTKLESRPTKAVLGEYIFLVDLEGHRREPHVAEALERISAKTGLFKVFGSYPRWRG
jgi:prephenate dehydratase